MEYGLYVVNSGPHANREMMVGMAQLAEQLGYVSVFAGDHVALPDQMRSTHPYGGTALFNIEAYQQSYDQLVALTYLAALTQRVKLITSVLVVPQRNPLVTAKQLASCDDLSGGRLVLGVGVGWLREEYEALGADFERRGAIMDEYLEIYRRAFTEHTFGYEGKRYRFEPIRSYPKPAQRPHPPIWIGGHSRPALRRAARVGDGWHATRQTAAAMRQGLTDLRAECEKIGRDPAELTISLKLEVRLDRASEAKGDVAGTPEQIAERLREMKELGIHEIVIEPRPIRTFVEQKAAVERFWHEVRPLVEA